MFVVGGESLVDLLSDPGQQRGSFVAMAGGSPLNCAVALAKLGTKTGFLCPVSHDTFGELILKPLKDAGVVLLLKERVREPTTLAVVADDGNGNPRYTFYREADRAFTAGSLLASLPEEIEIFQMGGFCTVRADDLEVWLKVATAARGRGAIIATDPNLRPTLVDDLDLYRARVRRSLELASIVKVSEEDLETLGPAQSIDSHAAQILQAGQCKLVVVTLGANGSRAFTATTEGRCGIYPAARGGDNIGAGDTMMAAILNWLHERRLLTPNRLNALSPGDLRNMLWFGAVAAGINCGRKGASPPTRAELDVVLREIADGSVPS